MSDAPTAVDLFCGAGGASCGIDAAGFNLVAAVDQNAQALQTHVENFGHGTIHDLTDVDPQALPEAAPNPDYVHGSPPCQGFSTAAGDHRDADDPRNSLVFDFVDWVEALSPRVVTMENVPGMATIAPHFMDKLVGAFREAGYTAKWRELNAADFGVPQTRKRIITVVVRADLPVPSRWFPRPTHAEAETTTLDGRELAPWVTVEDAIGDLTVIDAESEHRPQGDNGSTSGATWRPRCAPAHTVKSQGTHVTRPVADDSSDTVQAETQTAKVQNHTKQEHTDETERKFASMKPGECGTGVSNRRLKGGAPSFTITASSAAVPPVHYRGPVPNHDPRESTAGEPMDWEAEEPSETLSCDARLPDKDRAPGPKSSQWDGARRLTVRECARLQSFPDWFVFTGTKTNQYKQVGNAVPPLLQARVAARLRDYMAEIDGGAADE